MYRAFKKIDITLWFNKLIDQFSFKWSSILTEYVETTQNSVLCFLFFFFLVIKMQFICEEKAFCVL